MPGATIVNGETITADETYTLEEFQRRARLGRHAFRRARDAGLKIVRTGGRVFVRGSAWIEYLAKLEAEQNETTTA